MAEHNLIPPLGDGDVEGAKRFFKDFLSEYQPLFTKVDVYLGQLVKTAPEYADAYLPWKRALQDLSRGVYFTVKNIPLPNLEKFLEALKMFTFEGAVHFIEDICADCKLALEREWSRRFREHIDMLLFAFVILQKGMRPAMVPAR